MYHSSQPSLAICHQIFGKFQFTAKFI